MMHLTITMMHLTRRQASNIDWLAVCPGIVTMTLPHIFVIRVIVIRIPRPTDIWEQWLWFVQDYQQKQ